MNWCTYEQEYYALVESLERRTWPLYTDCKPELTAKQAQSIGYVNLLDYIIELNAEKDEPIMLLVGANNVAGGLSRQFSKSEPDALRTNIVRVKIDITP